MRLTQALRHMYLPGIGKEVHPFIQALRTQEDQARVIQYIFKKYSKIRGGELRKDTFVHGDEDDLVGRVPQPEGEHGPEAQQRSADLREQRAADPPGQLHAVGAVSGGDP